MAKRTEQIKEIVSQSDAELRALVSNNREQLRAERFKDKFSRKAGIIRTAKKQIARSLTVLKAREEATKATK